MPNQIAPLVCAIMLTKDRPEMADRAVRAFRAQTYRSKMLLIVNSGEPREEWEQKDWIETRNGTELILQRPQLCGFSIGAIRNYAHEALKPFFGCVIAHWDDDDWSHPFRIEEQVRHLTATGADAVGYSDLMFWRTEPMCEAIELPAEQGDEWKRFKPGPIQHVNGEAWRWFARTPLTPPPGSSLMYWRRVWEKKHFAKTSSGEDYEFCKGLDVRAVPSMSHLAEPRMVCAIHGGNTSNYSQLEQKDGGNWHRAPGFDQYCRERMKL